MKRVKAILWLAVGMFICGAGIYGIANVDLLISAEHLAKTFTGIGFICLFLLGMCIVVYAFTSLKSANH